MERIGEVKDEERKAQRIDGEEREREAPLTAPCVLTLAWTNKNITENIKRKKERKRSSK